MPHFTPLDPITSHFSHIHPDIRTSQEKSRKNFPGNTYEIDREIPAKKKKVSSFSSWNKNKEDDGL
jgi:hypothetical protein